MILREHDIHNSRKRHNAETRAANCLEERTVREDLQKCVISKLYCKGKVTLMEKELKRLFTC
jgi:hypothetical protein